MRHLRRTKPAPGNRFKDYWTVRATMRLMRDELKHVNGYEQHVAHLEQLQDDGWQLSATNSVSGGFATVWQRHTVAGFF